MNATFASLTRERLQHFYALVQLRIEHGRIEDGALRCALDNGATLDLLTAPGAGWMMERPIGKVVLGAGGVFPLGWPGRGLAWLLIDAQARPREIVEAGHFARAWIGHLLSSGRYRRIEMTVPVADAKGRRFAKTLGFALEAYMKKFGPQGEDHFLHARTAP